MSLASKWTFIIFWVENCVYWYLTLIRFHFNCSLNLTNSLLLQSTMTCCSVPILFSSHKLQYLLSLSIPFFRRYSMDRQCPEILIAAKFLFSSGGISVFYMDIIAMLRVKKVAYRHTETPILTPIDLEELTVNLNTLYPPYQLMRYIIFVWKGHENMFSCIGSRVKPVMREILHVLDASSEFRVPQSEATSPPTNVSSVLTTRRWPIRQETDWRYSRIASSVIQT